MIVTNGDRHWTAYCFRCGERGWFPKPQESLSERIARRARESSQDERIASTVALPEPINTDVATWPQEAAVWLYKAGIGKPEIAQLGAYFHEPSARVVIPVIEGGEPVYWQARDPFWTRASKRPKYINPTINRQALVAKYGDGNPLVLTEDVLSAFRVGQCTEAWALLGTKLTDGVLANILTRGGAVRVWLDGDGAGRKASRTIINGLRACGVDAVPIHTQRDPKLYSKGEILFVTRLDAPASAKDAGNV